MIINRIFTLVQLILRSLQPSAASTFMLFLRVKLMSSWGGKNTHTFLLTHLAILNFFHLKNTFRAMMNLTIYLVQTFHFKGEKTKARHLMAY